tara:strand:+ start:354 stop:809 length:456 start_codon:yes stop_codon:yes gene_type:complete
MDAKKVGLYVLGGVGVVAAYKYLERQSNKRANIKDIIQNWVNTVCTHNPQAIVDLYAPDGVLVGTIADDIKIGRQEIIKYFNMFVEKKPCGIITSISTQNYGDYAIADGTYDFTLEEDGKKEVVPARFTFVLRRNKGVWQIATHHSSAQPE